MSVKKSLEKDEEQLEEVIDTGLTPEEYLNELIPFYSIKDNERYKDDIVITINGKAWQIQRGQHVMLPRFVTMAIMDAERQKNVASMTSQQFEDQYKSLSSQNLL